MTDHLAEARRLASEADGLGGGTIYVRRDDIEYQSNWSAEDLLARAVEHLADAIAELQQRTAGLSCISYVSGGGQVIANIPESPGGDATPWPAAKPTTVTVELPEPSSPPDLPNAEPRCLGTWPYSDTEHLALWDDDGGISMSGDQEIPVDCARGLAAALLAVAQKAEEMDRE